MIPSPDPPLELDALALAELELTAEDPEDEALPELLAAEVLAAEDAPELEPLETVAVLSVRAPELAEVDADGPPEVDEEVLSELLAEVALEEVEAEVVVALGPETPLEEG